MISRLALRTPKPTISKALAIGAGAIECDRNMFVGHLRRLRPVYGIYGLGNPAQEP